MNRTIKSILLYHKDKKSHPLQSYFSVEEQGQTPFISGGTPLRGANQAQSAGDQPPIGRINRRIYWSVFLGALLMLVGMVNMIAQGVLAISFESTIPLAITAPAMTLENFAITTGFSGGVPVWNKRKWERRVDARFHRLS